MLTTFKYDMRMAAKQFVPLYAVIFVIISLLIFPIRHFVFPWLDTSVVISGNRYIYASGKVFLLLAYSVPIYLYYISAFGRRSILCAMLPISAVQKISAKLLCTVIWYTISFILDFINTLTVCAVCDKDMFSLYLTNDLLKRNCLNYSGGLSAMIFSVLFSVAVMSLTLRLKQGKIALITLIAAVLLPLEEVLYKAYAIHFNALIRRYYEDLSPIYTPYIAEFILFVPLCCILFPIVTFIENRRKLIR